MLTNVTRPFVSGLIAWSRANGMARCNWRRSASAARVTRFTAPWWGGFPKDTKALCGCSYGEFGEYAHHLQDLIGFSSELHALRIDLIADEIGPPGESLTPSRDQVRYEARSRASLVNFGALLQPSAAFAAARCSWCTRTSGHSCGPHSKLA